MKVSAKLKEAEASIPWIWRSLSCKFVYRNNPWMWKKYALWSLASLFLRVKFFSSERSKPYFHVWSWMSSLIGIRECRPNLFYSDSLNENPPLAIQQIYNNTQVHVQQSSGYSLLKMHRCAANIYVDLPKCHAEADFHFPFEVKDSMEKLMRVTEFSLDNSTNAHPPSSLHTVHGVWVLKLTHPRLAQLLSSCNNEDGRTCWWQEILCPVLVVVTHLRYMWQDIQVEMSQEPFKMLPGFVQFCEYV